MTVTNLNPKPTPVASIPGFRSVIFDAQQLSAQPYLEHLQLMLNNAYHHMHAGLTDTLDPNSCRFKSTDELSAELGVHGRFCLVFRDGEDEDEQVASRPVASAMIKYFNADLSTPPFDPADAAGIPLGAYTKEPEHVHDIGHWEISAVAISVDDPTLRSRGLGMHMSRRLEQDVRARMQASKLEVDGSGAKAKVQENGGLTDVSDSSHCAPPKVVFWARATTRDNAPYWQRRGFDRVRVDTYPKGYWGMLKELDVMTLKKKIPSTIPLDA